MGDGQQAVHDFPEPKLAGSRKEAWPVSRPTVPEDRTHPQPENTMSNATRPLAVVTGASTGIGYELAKQCAENGFDLVIAANEPRINTAALELQKLGAAVDAVEVDLGTID